MLRYASEGATFLLNSIYGPEEVWDHLPIEVQRDIIEKKIRFYMIDAYDVAQKTGMGTRTTPLCKPASSPSQASCRATKPLNRSRNRSRRPTVSAVKPSSSATSMLSTPPLQTLYEVKVPAAATSTLKRREAVPANAPDFVRNTLARSSA